MLGHTVIDIDLHEVDLGIHLRHAELGVLLLGERLAEQLAVHHVVARDIEGPARIGNAADG